MKKNIIPVKSYPNADTYKLIIYRQNLKKSGIYRWNNLITNKSYIGSARCLTRRLYQYYSPLHIKYSLKKSKSIIFRSLLKYKYFNFSLDILEYCKPDLLIEREQYYIDTLKPEYNILRTARGSQLDRKHSLKIKQSISSTLKNYYKKILPVVIINLRTDEIKFFPNSSEAASYLGTSINTLSRYKKEKKMFRNEFLILNNIDNNNNYGS